MLKVRLKRLYLLLPATVDVALQMGMEALLPYSSDSYREDTVALLDFVDHVR